MKVLITGATGYLGKAIKEDLEDWGCQVIAGSRNAETDDFDVNFSQSDFDRSLARFGGVTSIIHLAASTSTYPHSDELQYFEALLDYCRNQNIQFITMSSISAFSGNTNPYSALKMRAEEHGKKINFGVFLKLGIVLGCEPQGASKKIYDTCRKAKIVPLFFSTFKIFVTDEKLLISKVREILDSKTRLYKEIEMGSEVPINQLMIKVKNSLQYPFIPIAAPYWSILMALKLLKSISQSFAIRQVESLIKTSHFLASKTRTSNQIHSEASRIQQDSWDFESKNVARFWRARFAEDLGLISAEHYKTSCIAAGDLVPCTSPMFLLFPQAFLTVLDAFNVKSVKRRLLIARILQEHLNEDPY